MSFLVEFLTSFGLGITANLNPCVLPLYPGFLSYLSNKPEIANKTRFTRVSGLIVLSGVLMFMTIVGAITTSFGFSINKFVGIASPIAFGVLIVLGIILIFDVELGRLLPQTKIPVTKNPYSSAFIYGFFYGPIVIPCNAPLVFAVFAYSVGGRGFFRQICSLFSLWLGPWRTSATYLLYINGQRLLVDKKV